MAGRQTGWRRGGVSVLSLLHPGHRMLVGALGPGYFQAAAYVPDRLGSRDGGTEVEGEAIYPRRIRRCVTEVWTVAAGQ
ncbi:hypothetical protein ILYODFUR_008042 [Ilyodon furcidens]|uniref:Uncharacterized protein n=1 Tax=Ilyodon furcidens TaxID=33524 RepID=A0ABV0T925_9TELE